MTDPFRPQTPLDVPLLRRVFAGVGYTADNLVRVGALPRRGDRVPIWELRERATGEGALETLVRTFFLASPEPAELLERALTPLGVAPLLEAGLLRDAGAGRLAAEAALTPIADWLVLRDFTAEVTGVPDRPDKVLPVGAASMMAAQLCVRTPCRLAVDLGTGQGFQALACAHHAQRTIATDITPRSLNFAAMNARLAGVDGLETRLGSFFEPLADLAGRVDRLVCNPPFVVAPPQNIVGYSTPFESDGAVEHIVRGAPACLAEGGFAAIIANWTHAGADDWARRPRAWVQGSGCDAWILRFSVLPARAYALKWLEETGTPRDRITPALLADWCAYYDRRGIGAISTGAFILRKRAGANWVRADERDFDRELRSFSDQILRTFAGVTLTAACPDAADLLRRSFVLTPDATLIVQRGLSDQGWKDRSAVLRQFPGFPTPVELTPLAQMVLAALAPGVPASGAVAEVARRLGADRAVVLEQIAPLFVQLLRDGHLVEP